MFNWLMELNSLKNLSCCEKGSWFKSPNLPAGREAQVCCRVAAEGLAGEVSWVAQRLLWPGQLAAQ